MVTRCPSIAPVAVAACTQRPPRSCSEEDQRHARLVALGREKLGALLTPHITASAPALPSTASVHPHHPAPRARQRRRHAAPLVRVHRARPHHRRAFHAASWLARGSGKTSLPRGRQDRRRHRARSGRKHSDRERGPTASQRVGAIKKRMIADRRPTAKPPARASIRMIGRRPRSVSLRLDVHGPVADWLRRHRPNQSVAARWASRSTTWTGASRSPAVRETIRDTLDSPRCCPRSGGRAGDDGGDRLARRTTRTRSCEARLGVSWTA